MPWISDGDMAMLRLAMIQREHIRERFRIKTQCSVCGYQSMDIYPEQMAACPHYRCSGGMEPYERSAPAGG